MTATYNTNNISQYRNRRNAGTGIAIEGVTEQQTAFAAPHSVEAEEAVLGSLLIEREAILKVAALLQPDDFFSLERANLYRALCALYQAGEPGDLLLVRQQLREMKLLGDDEGQVKATYLLKLMSIVPSPVHILFYAEVVRKHSASRRLLSLGTELAAGSLQPDCEPGKAMASFGDQLQQLINWWRKGQEAEYFLKHEITLDIGRILDTSGQPNSSNGDADPSSREGIKDGRVRLGFGFNCLDGKAPDPWGTGGIEPTMLLLRSTLTAITADTSVGKTILAEQIAENNARKGANVLFFHNELSHQQMLWRRNTRLTGIPVWKQAEPQHLSEREVQQVVMAAANVDQWKGRIDYVFCPDWTARQIAEEARGRHLALAAGTGRGYDLIVTDYLQNMAMEEGGREMRAEKVARSVHTLHTLANSLSVAVIFTSQLTRDGSRDEGFIKPTLHGGLDSGSIERHSNQVLGLWRDGNNGELTGLKSTFGKRGWTQALQFVENRLEFVE